MRDLLGAELVPDPHVALEATGVVPISGLAVFMWLVMAGSNMLHKGGVPSPKTPPEVFATSLKSFLRRLPCGGLLARAPRDLIDACSDERDGEQVACTTKGPVPVLIAVKAIAIANTYLADDDIEIKYCVGIVDLENPEIRSSEVTSTYLHFHIIAK